MVPKGWEETKLIDTSAKEKYSFTGGPFGSDLKSSDYTDNGVRIIQLQNIGDGKFNNGYKIFTSEEKADELSSCNIFPGEIILSKMGDPVARATIIPSHHKRYLMASDGIRLKVDESKYDTFFIHEVINAPHFRGIALSKSTGSTRKRIGLTDLKNITFHCPPLIEQQKIAKILTTWDKAISNTERLIENSTQQKKALMQQLLTGKKRLLDNEGKRFAGEWESLTIGDVVELFNGYAFKSSDALEKGYKWLKIANVGIGEIKWDNSSYLPEGYENEYNRFNLKVGDVVVAMTRPTLGNQLKIARLKNKDDESLLNQRVAKLLFSEKVSSEYMYQLLSTIGVALKLNHALLGTDPPNLSTKVLHEISMELPPLIEQQKIATVLTNADKEIELLEQQLADLQQEKKALMQVLLTGKKRVVVDGEIA